MANTNSTIFEIANTTTSFPFPTMQTGTIETVGKDVIGTGTYFQGIDIASNIVLSGTVYGINSVSVGYITGGPNPTGLIQLCGAVPAAANLNAMAADIATAINGSPTSTQFQALTSGSTVILYPIVPNNATALQVVVDMASASTMVATTNPFLGVSNLYPSSLKGQQWIFNPISYEVSKVDLVRDNVSAHLKDAFVSDIPAATTFYTIEENHWHAIEFLNAGTVAGYIDGVTIPPGVSVPFNKASQDGFGTFNMIDPKVINAPEGCIFLVTVY